MSEEQKSDIRDERPETEDLKEATQTAASKFARSFKGTWRLYRQSKSGLLGLGIVVGFVFMAVSAPWLAPYDKNFRAPSLDTFISDYASMNLTSGYNWTNIIGLTASQRDHPLERILVYSQEGPSLVFPVSDGISEITGQLGIEIGDPSAVVLPAKATYLAFAHFSTSFFFFLNSSSDGMNSTLYEYDSAMTYVRQHELPFVPLYSSNLWNGFSFVVQDARLALAFADEHNVWMLNKRPPTSFETGIDSVNYINQLSIPNATVVGNPLVVDGDFQNGSMLFVPTDSGIWAYELKITRNPISLRILDIRIGDRVWASNNTVPVKQTDGTTVYTPFEPVTGNHMIAFRYPYFPTTPIGKEHVTLATRDNQVIAYARASGNITWANKLILSGIRGFEITALHSSPDNLAVVGVTEDERGLVAGLDPKTGRVANNNTMFSTVDSRLNSEPQYVIGQYTYIFSTASNFIYLMTNSMRVNATFSAPGGGAAIPVAFLGNIYIEGSRAGNYFGVVTKDEKLFVETLTGVNVAPLPPGRYPSGNYYPMGTDYEGQDILTQLMYGTQAELIIGVTAALVAVVIGTIVGLVAGFYGGLVDDFLMRLTDVMLALPFLVIMLLFAAVFGPSLFNIIIIFAILSWAGIARVIRSVTLSIKERAFIDAAIVAGSSESRLIFRHIGPNVLPYTFLYMTFTISGAIVTEAILAFLGFGDPTNITWGMMLQFLQISGHSLDAPWWLLPPGIAITMLSLSFYLIGRAFDEVVNPRLRKR